MSTHKTIFIVGLIIFVMPFLGFPSEFEISVNTILALFLMFFAVVIRLKKHSSAENHNDPIVVDEPVVSQTEVQGFEIEPQTQEDNQEENVQE